MKRIAENKDLLKIIIKKNFIWDSKILRIEIFENDFIVNCKLFLITKYENEEVKILIEFRDLTKYSFYYDEEKIFYYIEACKFIYTDDKQFYLSIDPDPEHNWDSISSEDCGIIQSKEIAAYIIESVE